MTAAAHDSVTVTSRHVRNVNTVIHVAGGTKTLTYVIEALRRSSNNMQIVLVQRHHAPNTDEIS